MSNASESGDLLCVIVSFSLSLSLSFNPIYYLTSLLSILSQLDLNPFAWTQSAQPTPNDIENDKLSLEEALDQVLIFCNAHLALLHSNELAVFGASLGSR